MVEPRKGVFPACNSQPSSNHTSSCRDSQPGLRSTREEEGVERPTSDTKTPKENRTWGKELQGEFPSLTVNMAEVGTAVGCGIPSSTLGMVGPGLAVLHHMFSHK